VNHRGASRPIQHHEFEQVRCPVRPEYQKPIRIIANLIDGQRMHHGVLDVLRFDAMPVVVTGLRNRWLGVPRDQLSR
jgi:hypothetical protein